MSRSYCTYVIPELWFSYAAAPWTAEYKGSFAVSVPSSTASSMTQRSILPNASSPFKTGLFKQASKVHADLTDVVRTVSIYIVNAGAYSFESR